MFCLAGFAWAYDVRVNAFLRGRAFQAVWFVNLDKHFSAKQIRFYLAHTNHSCSRLLRMRSFAHTIHSAALLYAFSVSRLCHACVATNW